MLNETLAMASSRYDLNCWWDIKNSNTHAQNICQSQAKLIISDHSCSLNSKIFKLIKKYPEKISGGGGGGGGLHNICYIMQLILSIILHVIGWG